MKKYDKDEKCCKCGGGDIEDEHVDEVTQEMANFMTDPAFNFAKKKFNPHPERISRTCKNCGHSWDTRPLDADEKPTTVNASDAAGRCDMAATNAALDDLVKDDVIEVGDTVEFERGLQGMVLMDYHGELLIKLNNDWTTCSSDSATLIRKAPKVHVFEEVILQPTGYLNEEEAFQVEMMIPMKPPSDSKEWEFFRGNKTITIKEGK